MTYDYFPVVSGIHSAVPTSHRDTSGCVTTFCITFHQNSLPPSFEMCCSHITVSGTMNNALAVIIRHQCMTEYYQKPKRYITHLKELGCTLPMKGHPHNSTLLCAIFLCNGHYRNPVNNDSLYGTAFTFSEQKKISLF